MNYKVTLWWQRLSEKEQNILIELLYDLNLDEYVEMDKDGNIIGRFVGGG